MIVCWAFCLVHASLFVLLVKVVRGYLGEEETNPCVLGPSLVIVLEGIDTIPSTLFVAFDSCTTCLQNVAPPYLYHDDDASEFQQ